MARIDQHRLTKLHRRYLEIRRSWTEIRCSSSIFVRHGKQKSQEFSKSSAAGEVGRYLAGEFAAWSAQVVDAFSLDPFPSYESEPPMIEGCNESDGTRIQLIAGFEDPIQAGLQIILWAQSGTATRQRKPVALPIAGKLRWKAIG
jgi:hypothetical protein